MYQFRNYLLGGSATAAVEADDHQKGDQADDTSLAELRYEIDQVCHDFTEVGDSRFARSEDDLYQHTENDEDQQKINKLTCP